MNKENIKANIIWNWNREKNKGCKFVPGDRAVINNSLLYMNKKWIGTEGVVRAVTVAEDGFIRGVTKFTRTIGDRTITWNRRRCATHYYLQIDDNEYLRVEAHYLDIKL